MTASDLFAIVKDVPREAWPEQFDWYECGGDTPYRCFTVNGEEYNYKNNLLEVAFVGSMTAWLARNRKYSTLATHSDGTSMVALPDRVHSIHASSLVAALAAACKEVGSDK